MIRRHRIPVFALAVAITGLTAWIAAAAEFGSFTLQPGQSQTIRIGSTYRQLKVCNDTESAGQLDAIIGTSDVIHLAPAICAEWSGDTIQLHNVSNGVVSGIYRRQVDSWDGM
jgi:precorrin-4 methylase